MPALTVTFFHLCKTALILSSLTGVTPHSLLNLKAEVLKKHQTNSTALLYFLFFFSDSALVIYIFLPQKLGFVYIILCVCTNPGRLMQLPHLL